MTRYRLIDENVERVTSFQGSPVIHPIHQCKDCGHSISPGFAKSTGVCGLCYDGKNDIGEYLNRIYSVSIYCKDFSDHKLTNAIQNEVKQGEYAEEMSEILDWGMKNLGDLQGSDFLVPPPRGSEDAGLNHMEEIGDRLSSKTGIPVLDVLRKRTPYPSQKQIDDPDERMENVRDNIECITTFDDSPVVVVIDDVVTSTGTMKYSAKSLKDSGAGEVFGLTISRSEGVETLESQEVYEQVSEDD